MIAKYKIGDLLVIGKQYIYIIDICYQEIYSHYQYYFIDRPEQLMTSGIAVIDKHFTQVREDANDQK